jgi:hypothetical protein
VGARSHLPGPLRTARRAAAAGTALVGSLALAACLDFVEPDIPHAGQPATLQARVVVSPDGMAVTTAEFSTGFDGFGLPRDAVDETLRAFGRELQPVQGGPGEARHYLAAREVTPAEVMGPITVEPPTVEGTTAPAPTVWYGLRRVGPDSLALGPAEDLVLELDVGEGGTATIRQWFLTMAGGPGSIRVSGDGPPPERLVIPTIWVPEPREDGTVEVFLNYVQTDVRAGPAGDYVVAASLHVGVRWIVRALEGPGG